MTTETGLMDRLEATIRERILAHVPDRSGRLASMELRDLLSEYGTWRSRLISQVPRRCHLSSELLADRRAARQKADLDALVSKIEAGTDLGPHLSDRVWAGHDAEAPALAAREDRDLLLADWGVHHLHLTPGNGDDLVFAVFRPEDAYLIGLYRHRDWARRSILEKLIRNWPDAGLVIRLNGVIGLTNDWTDRERKQLREAGIAGPMIECDRAVWAAASLGLTLDGTPMRVAQTVMGVSWTLNDWRGNLTARLAEAERVVNEQLGRTAVGDWEPAIHGNTAGIMRDGCFVAICELP
jgi:hypothetical protein